MVELIRVYALRNDRHFIANVRRGAFEAEDNLLVPEPWLFGSQEWWRALDEGNIPVHTVSGTISRMMMTGHNDYEVFEIDDGTTTTEWTPRVSEQPPTPRSPLLYELYREGAAVRVLYVTHRLKKPDPVLGLVLTWVLEIWLEHRDQPPAPPADCRPSKPGFWRRLFGGG